MSDHQNTPNIEPYSISPDLRMALEAIALSDIKSGIKQRFVDDPERANRFSFELEDCYFDFSKTHISRELITLYEQLADEIDFVKRRHDLFSGVKINNTEGRSVLHTLLRDPNNQAIEPVEAHVLEEARIAKNEFFSQYRSIENKLRSRDTPIKDIIHVGIGGSSLGTQLVIEALQSVSEKRKVHFLGNIDGHQLAEILAHCDVRSTLVIGVSKTFSTAETLQNINSIGEWFAQNGILDFLQSVYAVTAKPGSALAFGIPPENTIVFPEWVGGRYSVWSAVSLSAALILGEEKFSQFLNGAASVDRHFYSAEPSVNLCFIAAMMDNYYRNYFACSSRAIFAYDYRLRSLVDYLQQLETESNGKDRQNNGKAVDQLTSPVVWGGVGTNVQHSVFQMLHQGTNLIPSEFILIRQADHELEEHHAELLANGLAQTAALLQGQDLQTVKAAHAGEGLSELALKAKIFSGNRPSVTILMERLTARSLGAVLAFYEHRTFCNGLFCNINSFDQMGVELGKRLAKELKPLLGGPDTLQSSDFDRSTLNLINRVKQGR